MTSFPGYLSVDDVLIANGKSKQGSSSVNHIEKIYFGGVPKGAKRPSQLGVSSISSIPF